MDTITFLAVAVTVLTFAIAYSSIELRIKLSSIELEVNADRKDAAAEKKEEPDHESDSSSNR